MKLKQALFGIVAGACLLAAPQLQSAAFMKLGDIKGEATDESHREWIDVLSTDWGVIMETEPGTSRATPKPKPMSCARELDKASPKIMEAIATGRVFPKVDIHLTRSVGAAGQVVYYKYELTNVMVTSFNTSGTASGDPLPTEQISLNFEEIKVTYTEHAPGGQVVGEVVGIWNVVDGTSQ